MGRGIHGFGEPASTAGRPSPGEVVHPYFCRILDSGEADGATYLVTEFVDGVTLRGLLKASTAACPTASLEGAPNALHTAHLAGVVHRDIKPGDLMVAHRGDPMVLNFGLAQDDARASSRLTRTGSAPGTPAYMAPESLHGFPQVLRSIEERVPTPVRHINSALPKELEVVLAVAMAKNPRRRHADLRAFAEDLGTIRERRPSQTRHLGFGLRAKRWMQRHPVWTTLGLSACVLLGMRSLQTRNLLEEKQQPGGAVYFARTAMEVKKDSIARSALLSA